MKMVIDQTLPSDERGRRAVARFRHGADHENNELGEYYIQGVCFNWDPPISVPKRNMAIQPITEPVSVNPVSKKDCDWLLGSFLFGT